MKGILVKTLQYSFRCIYYASIVTIALRIIIFIIESIFIVKVISIETANRLELFKFYALPLGIICTLFGTIKKGNKNIVLIEKLNITLILALITSGFSFFSIFTEICDYTITKSLFINVNDTTNMIVETKFGCGAYDSDPERVDIFEVNTYFNTFSFFTRVDTALLDRNNWTAPTDLLNTK